MRFWFIIVFVLYPSIVFGGVGDVYYCSMTSLVKLKESEVKKYQTQKFKFKRLEDKIIFGSEKNYFKDIVLDKKFRNFDETFIFTDELISHDLKYKDGLIIITSTTFNDVVVINGECSTF